MEKKVTIRLSGNALDLSTDGKSPPPNDLRELLEAQLRYKYVQIVRGQAAYDRNGRRMPIKTETRIMYESDKYGRMVCGVGFLSRITNLAKKLGYEVITEDLSDPHPRTDRYTVDFDNVAKNFEFRERQDEILVKVATNQRGVIEALTGAGKSYLFAAICLCFPKARILVTTKRRDVVESIRLHLTKWLPNIGQIGGGINKPARITVITADSLHKVTHDDWDIILMDECHELIAPSYATELVKFRCARIFGFSATPTSRMDGTNIRLESLAGPIIFSMSYQEGVEAGLVVPIRVRFLDVILQQNPALGRTDVPRIRWGIWRNQERNRIIAAAAREFKDDQVLIMVTTFDHAVHLKQFLPEFTLCYAERSDDKAFDRFISKGMLSPDEPKIDTKRRQLLRRQFEMGELRKVIATDVWSTGVSFSELGVLIRADARQSTIMDSQIPGRVCRLHAESGKQEGLVIDLLDQFDPGFRAAAAKRRRNYEAKGWLVELPTENRQLLDR